MSMSRKRLVSILGGTVFSALAIGIFMQRGESAAPRNLVPPLPPEIQQVVLPPSVSAAPTPLRLADVGTQVGMQNLVLASSVTPVMVPPSLPEPALRGVLTVAATANGEIVPVDPVMPTLGCETRAVATPAPMAMVELEILAPCYANERVTIHHNGLIFTQATDDAGRLSVTVPALSDRAVFIIAFADGRGTVALTSVPDLTDYERVVVQWTGKAGFQIHAREFGASYGDPGHAWSGVAPQNRQSAGMVVRLGDPDTLEPQMAEIYTFPSGTSSKSGVVALSVEAEVTPENCGREVSAQALELRNRSGLRIRDLEMAFPDCSALGEFLVLNNLVDDLKIAAK